MLTDQESVVVRKMMDVDQGSNNDMEAKSAREGPSLPSPPSLPLRSRKRAASLDMSATKEVTLEDLKIDTARKPDGPHEGLCLCTPGPKIPRPRNAFILYRQHHQSKVSSDNPGLTNPDISKVIGEQWQQEKDEVKFRWKALAEEEKRRHLLQYPDYRYQPRRGSRTQNGRQGGSPDEDHGRCTKCHGRSIATPATPPAPFLLNALNPTSASPVGSKHAAGDSSSSGRSDTAPQPKARRTGLSLSTEPFRDADNRRSLSPDTKRRRINGYGDSYVLSAGPVPYYTYRVRPAGEPMRTPTAPMTPRRLQGGNMVPADLNSLSRGQTVSMPPPPRSIPTTSWAVPAFHGARSEFFDESLRLPPLKTSIAPHPSSTVTEGDFRQGQTPVAGSAGSRISQLLAAPDTIMSIPFNRKLAVLSTICPALSSTATSTIPEAHRRGALIAMEGPKPRMLREVGQAVERALTECGQVELKCWQSSESARDLATVAESLAAIQAGDISSSFHGVMPAYFNTVLGWQDKSAEIVQYLTSQNGEHKSGSRRGSVSDIEVLESQKPLSQPTGKVPVALIQEGYGLTLSDRAACAAPLSDRYAPADHWQWMATLWRGIVGPDLTMYVKPSVDDEITQYGTVDFQRRSNVIVVRLPTGRSLDEGTERRMSFEVVEWLREWNLRGQQDRY